jgi:hypothetical protein
VAAAAAAAAIRDVSEDTRAIAVRAIGKWIDELPSNL